MSKPAPQVLPGLADPVARGPRPEPPAVARSWLDALIDWRDRQVTRPAFRRWAAAFPLTRPLARRRARELFDLVAGFVYTQVLTACVRLKLFDLLADGPLTLGEIARRTQLPEDGARRLLDAAVSLRLLARRGGSATAPRYGLGALGAPMVGNGGISAMVDHHAALYADLRDPVALLRGEGTPALSDYWVYANNRDAGALADGQVADYSALMAASQPLVAEQVLDAYPLARHRVVMDVGGGEGAFLAQVARRAPHLQLRLYDLPAVAERGARRLADAGFGDRTTALGGDFRRDPLPTGADLITLVRVAFDHPDETVVALMRAARRALPDDGALLLAEPMAGIPGAEPVGDAYFGFYLLAMGGGRARTPQALSEMLRAAGFGRVRELPTHLPLQAGVLLATPR